MSIQVGIDTGGTFTDLVVAEGGRVRVATKSLTTHGELTSGVLSALGKAGVAGESIDRIVHGTTVALNALITRGGARIGVITTSGFRDMLETARAWRPAEALLDPRWRRPQELRPIVPRSRRRTVRERVLSSGETLVELDEQALDETVADLVAEGCEGVAVCFLHSYKYPANERRAAELIRQKFPDLFVCLSSEVSPFPREYNRFSTCAINAFVQPMMDDYVGALERRLDDASYSAPLTFMTNDGSITASQVVVSRPVVSLNSGPVGGVIGVQTYAETLKMPNLVGFDMGGTSTDVAVIVEGRAATKRELELEHDLLVSLPVVEIHSIGAGGGSIAAIDEAGGLSVGPESAGSRPGPACYGQGGTRPTVTDAFLLLGILDPSAPLGGDEIRPDVEAAESAYAALGERLGASALELAMMANEVAIHNMAEAVRQLTIYRGVDPRQFGLLAYGAAGPVVATQVARTLSMPTVVIPALSGVFSAFGLLSAKVKEEEVSSVMALADEATVAEMFAAARRRAEKAIASLTDEQAGHRIYSECLVDATYRGQRTVLSATVDPTHADPFGHFVEEFETAHRRQFGYSLGAEIYIQTVRTRAIVADEATVSAALLEDGPPVQPTGRRSVAMGRQVAKDVPIYADSRFAPGQSFAGPAVIHAPTYTALLVDGDHATTNEVGDIVIEVGRQ